MTKQATKVDSGIRKHRVEFVREDEKGITPTDPQFNLFSDTLESTLVAEADAQIEQQRGVGSPDTQAHFAGPEDSTASIEYHLQNFFVDGSGNPLDAAGDAILRGNDNDIQNTHTVIDRAEYGSERTYIVMKGGHPELGDISGDPSSGLPILVSLDYEAQKIRSYTVTQPNNESLSLKSTSTSDTTQSVKLESDDALTTEEVSLNGTTSVTTTESFDSIDGFELTSETEGDVIVSDSSSNELFRIRGSESYDGVEGDLGVPVLGAGSHASEIGTEYESFIDDYVARGGSELAAEIRSASFNVSNNYDKTAIAGTKQQAIHTGQRDIEFSATVAGNFDNHENLHAHLETQALDIVWEFDGGSVTFPQAVITDVGDIGPSAGDAISTQDNTFSPEGIQVQSN